MRKYRRLYRVAHRDNVSLGMYNSVVSDGIMDSFSHPVPTEDSLLCSNAASSTGDSLVSLLHSGTGYRKSGWYFGFNSVKQLSRWLYKHKWLHDLDREGYCLYVIYVPVDNFIEGSTQAIAQLEHTIMHVCFDLYGVVNGDVA